MKKLLYSIFLIPVCLLPAFSGGGPDAFGYVWYNDTDTSIVAYNWIDISTKAGVVTIPSGGIPPASPGLQDDNSFGLINIGFDFHYYWGDFDQLKVGSNGWLGFANIGNIASCFPTMTNTSPPHNYIAPMMSDLNFAANGSTQNPGSVQYWTNNADTFIISYETVPFWTPASPHTGANTFQVILCGTDSSITYQYGAVEQTLTYNCAGAGTTDWKYVQGIKAINGSTGLMVNATHDNLAGDNTAVKFFYPDSILLQIQDAAADAVLNSDNGGEFVLKDEPYVPQAYVANVGNVDISTPTTVNCNIIGLGYVSSVTIPAILQGQTFLVQFPDTLVPSVSGDFSFSMSISNSNDANPSNNSTAAEINVVEPDANGNLRLSYASSATPLGVSWTNGDTDDGIGIMVEPPFYPMVIRSLEHLVVADANNSGYIGDVRLPDPNGDPGPVVGSVVAPGGTFTPGTWNQLALTDSVKIDSGNVYVGMYMGGTGVTMGREDATTNPNGNRSYEILAGSWAPLRFAGSDSYIAIYIDTPSTQPPPVGIWDIADGGISLFPNPSDGIFRINGKTKQEGEFEWAVVDQLGRTVKRLSTRISGESFGFDVDLRDHESGVYYLVLGDSQGRKVFKLVKK